MTSILLSQRRNISRVLKSCTESSFLYLSCPLLTTQFLRSLPTAPLAIQSSTSSSSSSSISALSYQPTASFATATATKPANRKSSIPKSAPTGSSTVVTSSSSPSSPSSTSSSLTMKIVNSSRPEKAWKRKPFTKRANDEYLMENTVYEMDKNLAYLIKVGKPTPPSAAALDRLLRAIRTSNEFQIGVRGLYRSYTASIPPSNDTATLLAMAAIRTDNIPKVLDIFNQLQSWLPLSSGAMAHLYKAAAAVSSTKNTTTTTTSTTPATSTPSTPKATTTTTDSSSAVPSKNPNEFMNKIHTISRNEASNIELTANSTITAMLAAFRTQNYRLSVRLVQDFAQYRKHVIRKENHQQPSSATTVSSSSSSSTSPVTPPPTTTTTKISSSSPADLTKYIDSSIIRVYTKLLLYFVQLSTTTKNDPSSFSKEKLHQILHSLNANDLSFLHTYNQTIGLRLSSSSVSSVPKGSSSAPSSTTVGIPKVLEGILTLLKPEIEIALQKRTEEETKLKEATATKEKEAEVVVPKETATAKPEPTKKA